MFLFYGLLRSHGLRYSTVSSIDGALTDRKTHLIVDYLIKSLRFSKQEAISTSSKGKLTHLKSTANSDLVISILDNYGLDKAQIKDVVSYVPKILTRKANTTLEPKIRVFQELGLSGSDLVKLIKNNPYIFKYGLQTRIIPCLDLIRKLVGSDEKAIQVISKSSWVCTSSNELKKLSGNVLLLQNFGLLDERIGQFAVNYFKKLMVKPERLKAKLEYVEMKLGISRESSGFIHALNAVLWSSDSEIEQKMQVFRSFGWSDREVSLLLMAQPSCLTKSEANLREKLTFFMKDLGYKPSYLTSCNSFWTLSLKKRVIPRNMFLSILKEKKLVNDKLSLYRVVTYSEMKFLDFLRSFESDICQTYMNIVGRKSKPGREGGRADQ